MLIDMDPSSSPANTGTSFGTIEECARVNENDTLDADEDVVDTLEVDVIADSIPASNPAIYSNFVLNFPAGQVTVSNPSGNSDVLYATAHGWSIIDAGDVSASDGQFLHTIVDLNAAGTTGSGVLHRLQLKSAPASSPGVHPLFLTEAAHIDTLNFAQPPDNYDADLGIVVQDPPVFVAIDTSCPDVNVAIDTDPSASPANAATSIGTIEQCSVILNDDVLNADENAIDGLEADVVIEAPGVPTYSDYGTPDPNDDRWGLLSYSFSFNFDPTVVEIAGADVEPLISSNGGSNLIIADNGGTNPGQTFPNASGLSTPAVADQGPIPDSLESGEGILTRYTLEGVAAGVDVAVLTLTNVGILDVTNNPIALNSVSTGYVVLNEAGGCTSDLDGDGVPGIADNCPTIPNAGQQNNDSDPFGDACDNCPNTDNASQADSDGDGVGSACDNCPSVSNSAQSDSDSDGLGNVRDNCPSTSNAAQTDSDTDTVGDVCDNCPSDSNAAQTNSDSDAFGDVCDNCPSTTNQAQTDTDSDSLGDSCDSDDDDDGVNDADESGCGSDSLDAASRPERIDGAFAGVDDDLDGDTDEVIASASTVDCDGDGYSRAAEEHVYSPNIQPDQDPCGSAPDTFPFNTPIGWPADLKSGGAPLDSTNRINILDVTSFLAPVRYFNTDLGAHPGDQRWDLVPGKGIFLTDINVQDLTSILVLHPPMLGIARALGGPDCPWAP